jgi:hypothetical protein
MPKILFRPQITSSVPTPPEPPLPPQSASLSRFPFLRNYRITVELSNIRPPANYTRADFNIKDTTSGLNVTVQDLTSDQLTGAEEIMFVANDASYNDTRVYLIYTFADTSTQTVELIIQ